MRHTILGLPVSILYVIGVLATVYHLANGIWTSLITWGVTIGPSSQRAAGYACSVFGVMLAVAGVSAIWGFREFHGESSPAVVNVDSPSGSAGALADSTDERG